MFTSNRSAVSICDRLKQRYNNSQHDWQSLFKIQEKTTGDFEYIQYIVNFIIEQAKHNIVISELPDVIRTLHCEADNILRKNKTMTLEEVITQVQMTGAMKYPYLKKLKPITTEDFVKEVIREVFNRLGTIITLDMIENICQFTTCSAKQLLCTMPAIDVDEAATLIIEDISRNQRNSDQADIFKKSKSLSALMNRKLENTPVPIRAEHQPPRITKNSQQSSKNINKNQIYSSEKLLLEHKSIKTPKSTNFVSFDVSSKKTHPQIDTLVQEKTGNSLTANKLIDQKIKLSKSRSNTQTYSIHSEEGLSTQIHKPTAMSMSNMNGNANTSMFIKPTRSLNKILQKPVKQIHSHIAPSTNNIAQFFDEGIYSTDRSVINEVMHNFHPEINKSHSKILQSIHHYCCQDFDINGNQEQTIENNDEICPLEEVVNCRFLQYT